MTACAFGDLEVAEGKHKKFLKHAVYVPVQQPIYYSAPQPVQFIGKKAWKHRYIFAQPPAPSPVWVEEPVAPPATSPVWVEEPVAPPAPSPVWVEEPVTTPAPVYHPPAPAPAYHSPAPAPVWVEKPAPVWVEKLPRLPAPVYSSSHPTPSPQPYPSYIEPAVPKY